MPYFCTKDELPQLQDVLQSNILMLDIDDELLCLPDTKKLLDICPNCCVVIDTSKTRNKLRNIRALRKSKAILKLLQRQLCMEHPSLRTSLIGIYPSLQYPACVFEINTNSGSYVVRNILPYDGSPFKKATKYLLSKLLGANPAIGGLGLILYEE